VRGHALTDLLARPVRMNGIPLGRPVDVLLDAASARVVGFELVCGDGAHRFLPFSVAEVRDGEIAVDSALLLLDERDLDYYRARTRPIGTLGLDDPWIEGDGTVHETRTAA
jgi:hypothetical protein